MRHPQRSVSTSLLSLIVILAASAIAIAQGPSPAEENFWESIKASTASAEFRAYLDAFPKGFYADRARQRIAEIEGRAPGPVTAPGPTPPAPGPEIALPQPPNPSTDIPFSPQPGPQPPPNQPVPPLPPGTNPGASVLTTFDTIREVQERLFALNYNVRVINGQLSQETRDAIKAWQQVVRRQITGDLNGEDLAYLRSAPPIANWGAIGFEARGSYGIVWSRTSRQDAENDAMTECRKYANANAKDCQVFTLGDTQCAALSWYQGNVGGRQNWGSFVVRRGTLAEAQNDGLEECRKQAKAPKGCQVRVTFCADGSHKR